MPFTTQRHVPPHSPTQSTKPLKLSRKLTCTIGADVRQKITSASTSMLDSPHSGWNQDARVCRRERPALLVSRSQSLPILETEDVRNLDSGSRGKRGTAIFASTLPLIYYSSIFIYYSIQDFSLNCLVFFQISSLFQ